MARVKKELPAQQWLRTGQAPVERVVGVVRALALLSGEVPFEPAVLSDPLGEDIELALLIEADEREMLELVVLLRDHGQSRKVKKEAKKVLFRAKQRGAELPEPSQDRAAVSLAPRPELLPSYCSTYDGEGLQFVMYGGWTLEEGAFLIVAFLSGYKGLNSAIYFSDISQTRQRQLVRELTDNFLGWSLEVDKRYAAGRIRWGLERADLLHRNPEGDVGVVRRLMQGVEVSAEMKLSLRPEDEDEIEAHVLAGAELFQESCFDGWKPLPDDSMRAFLGRLERENRGLKLSDEALGERLRQTRDRFMVEALDEEMRRSMAGLLEVNAWLLDQAGKRRFAMQAEATAQGLRDQSRLVLELPFVQALIEGDLDIEGLSRFARQFSEVP